MSFKLFIATLFLLLVVMSTGNSVAATPPDGEVQTGRVISISPTEQWCAARQCQSSVRELYGSYDALAVEWRVGDEVLLRTRTSEGWSDWHVLTGEMDGPDEMTESVLTDFVVGDEISAIQIATERTLVHSVRVHAYVLPDDTAAPATTVVAANVETASPASLAMIAPRPKWLDGSIALSSADQQKMWPPSYDLAKKFVVHHTATTISDTNKDGAVDSTDYRQIVRAIYTYHAKTRRWGDIGYNYLIDPSGTIWEGRDGGDGVVGGHAYREASCKKFGASNVGFNRGTIGIALLGNYTNDVLTSQAKESLTNLIAQKSWEFGISPMGQTTLNGESTPNILGHRDVDCTECPGTQLYGALLDVALTAQSKYEQLQIASAPRLGVGDIVVSPAEVALGAGGPQQVIVTAKNTGTSTWRSYGTSPIYVARAEIKERLARLDGVIRVTAAGEGKDVAPSTAQQPSSEYMAARLLTPNVPPGAVGRFAITISEPPQDLIVDKKFVLALGDQQWLADTDVSVRVINTTLPWAGILEQSEQVATRTLLDATKKTEIVSFRNRGTETWKKGEVALRLLSDQKPFSLLALSAKQLRAKQYDIAFNEVEVKPGEVASFTVPLLSPKAGDFSVVPSLVRRDGSVIVGSDYAALQWRVERRYAASVVTSTLDAATTPLGRVPISVTIKNTGQLPWKAAQLVPILSKGVVQSVLYDAKSWDARSVIDSTKTVAPGDVVSFLVYVKAPSRPGTYRQSLGLKQSKESIMLMDDTGKLVVPTVVLEVQKPAPKPVAKKTVSKK